ncbi:hypothetical protein PINS_up014992 [Pythium insidiosum]|nr:hypothetical protein PINS_up014992 [Pythium insidiosum]
MKRPVAIVTPALRDELDDGGPTLGILEIKEARQRSAKFVVPARARAIVWRFWIEKGIAVIDALQLYALLWQLSQPWPWPADWLRATRWTNLFNLDVLAFTESGAAMGSTGVPYSLWGEMRLYWVYALTWALVPFASAFAWITASKRWHTSGHLDALARRLWWENVLLQCLYIVYLPIGLAVFRLINCDSKQRAAVDPYTFPVCYSTSHSSAVVLISGVLGGSFLLGFPWILRHRILAFLPYRDAPSHERFVQSKEFEYMIGTSDTFLELYIPVFASFRRDSVTFPVEMCIVKLALLATFSFLRSTPPSKSYDGLQGTLFFLVFVYIAWQRTWMSMFRSPSTNRLTRILHWQLVANAFFGKSRISLHRSFILTPLK